MDLSKLPKLSQTPEPTSPETMPTAEHRITEDRQIGSSELVGAEVWLSAIIGLVFLLVGRRFGTYVLSLLSHREFHTNVNWLSGPNAGQEVAYRQLEGFIFYNEAAMFLFGLALLFEAIVLLAIHRNVSGKRPIIMVALFIASLATAINVVVTLMLFTTGVLPLFSLLAVAFGGYIVFLEWQMLKSGPSAGA